jgi:hypothetical protein
MIGFAGGAALPFAFDLVSSHEPERRVVVVAIPDPGFDWVMEMDIRGYTVGVGFDPFPTREACVQTRRLLVETPFYEAGQRIPMPDIADIDCRMRRRR